MATATATATQTRTDEEIQRDVLAELRWDARVKPNEIGVIVKDGVVTLTGWVDSFIKKWHAEGAAPRVARGRALSHDLVGRLPGSAERTDTDIAADVRRALDLNILIPADKINVTVSHAIVTLQGEVEW